VPVALAVLFSFNDGRSQSVWQGFSLRWYYQDPVNSVLHDPALHAAVVQTIRLSVYVTLITVPLGVAFALGINRWRGHTASAFNLVMILSFVIPELIFGVAMFFVFTRLYKPVGLGTVAETLALVTWNLSWPALIVQARLVTLGKQHEEAAADLGATPWQVTYRVMMPLLTPAIFASAVLVFSSVVDDFVLVDLLSSNASNTPMSVYIYSQQRGGNGGPALNALGTIMLVMSFVVAIAGYLGYRWLTRGERGSGIDALTAITGNEG
jgi:spermidine/putrescine transport system permease protein